VLLACIEAKLVMFPSPKFIHPESKSPALVQLNVIHSPTSAVVGVASSSTSTSAATPNFAISANKKTNINVTAKT